MAIRQEQNAPTKKQAMSGCQLLRIGYNRTLLTVSEHGALFGRLEWKNPFDKVYGNI